MGSITNKILELTTQYLLDSYFDESENVVAVSDRMTEDGPKQLIKEAKSKKVP